MGDRKPAGPPSEGTFCRMSRDRAATARWVDSFRRKLRTSAIARGIASTLLKVLHRTVPKSGRSAIVRTFPDFDDNCRALLPALVGRMATVTVLVEGGAALPGWPIPDGVRVLPSSSIRGLFCYLRAHFVVYTHGIYLSSFVPRGQIVANIWHGMPIKKIGADIGQHALPRFTFTISTGTIFRSILSRSFACAAEVVRDTGLPRNDILFHYSRQTPEATVMILPTYRRSVLGELRIDGNEAAGAPSKVEISLLLEAAWTVGVRYLIKLHPMSPESEVQRWTELGTVVDESTLRASGDSLYSILGRSCALVTDYSSVAVDYLVTGRPIFMVLDDLEHYNHSRGLNFGPREISKLGITVSSYGDLADRIHEISSWVAPVPGFFYDSEFDGAATRVVDELFSHELLPHLGSAGTGGKRSRNK